MSSALTDSNDSTRGVTLPELLRRAQQAGLAESLHTMIPARVMRFDASTQQADLQVLVKDFHRDETDALVVTSLPLVTSVPVMFLTAGGFTFTVPIVADSQSGTTGALIFAERSMDRWLSGGGQEVDPAFYDRFGQSNAVFIPGLLPFGAPMSVAPPTDHATAGSITGARIHFRDGTITLGDEGGAQFVALANLVNTELAKVHSALSAHTHAAGTLAAGMVAVTGVTAPATSYTTADVSATQAKAK